MRLLLIALLIIDKVLSRNGLERRSQSRHCSAREIISTGERDREKKMYFSGWGLCPGKTKMYPLCLGILRWAEMKRYLFSLEIFYWGQTRTYMSKYDLYQ